MGAVVSDITMMSALVEAKRIHVAATRNRCRRNVAPVEEDEKASAIVIVPRDGPCNLGVGVGWFSSQLIRGPAAWISEDSFR